MISKVKKRDGRIVDFDKEKIQKAILKAFREVDGHISFDSLGIANKIVEDITINGKEEMEVEAIQNEIEKLLMDSPRADVAKAFIIYRNDRNRIRNKKSIIMKEAYELLEGKSEYWNTENSNKNPVLLSTQRDYMAGILSTEFTKAYLLDEDIVQAHEQGIIHFHDADYQAQRSISNCCLINLEDMLQNGTCINKVKIEKPHRLITATTIATQIITAVSSSQYGGATITLTHLAPFVRDSYNKHYAKYEKYGLDAYDCKKLAEIDTKKEIEDSVQTFNYQVNSMTTTNGQSPFLSVCMYMGETEEYKEELAMLIEEFLKQRLVGLKNEVGVYITQAFPKLLYVLEEDNIHEDSKYYYLTKLAAKCTAKRLVPDYISEKIMKEYKIDANGDGQCYPCMGCVDSQEVITYQYNGRVFTESFERMWNRMSNYFGIELQPNGKDYVMKTPGVLIFDQKKGFVDNYGIIKNHSSEWVKVTFSNGRVITCTPNHPFETVDGRIVLAGELTEADNIESDSDTKFKVGVKYPMKLQRAWLYGFTLCDSTYYDHIVASIAATGEEEIEDYFSKALTEEYGLSIQTKLQRRGKKGTYKDLTVVNFTENPKALIRLKMELADVFEGKAKADRHIPNEVFSWEEDSKLAFIAGMIDADGYLNTSGRLAHIQIGSTNKELAIQQALLAQSCGMSAQIYQNHYNSNSRDKIRYRVEFIPTLHLLEYICCGKKKDLRGTTIERQNSSIVTSNICHATSIEKFSDNSFSYDVTTASEHFTVSGIYSHNCRSFLTPYVDENGKPKYYGRLTA